MKFGFRIFDIFSQVLLNLFTFLINTTNQEVRALRFRRFVPRVLGRCATSFVSCVVYSALRALIPHPLRGNTLNYIFYRFKTHIQQLSFNSLDITFWKSVSMIKHSNSATLATHKQTNRQADNNCNLVI